MELHSGFKLLGNIDFNGNGIFGAGLISGAGLIATGTISGGNMRILANGDVGIGVTSPFSGTKLDVAGITRGEGSLYLDRPSGNMSNYFQIIARASGSASNFGNPVGNGAMEFESVAGSGLIVGTYSAVPLVFGTNNIERMRIDSSGNVGIGTTTPGTAKLYINGNTQTDTLGIGFATWGNLTYAGSFFNAFNVLGQSGKALSLGSDGIYDRAFLDTSGNFGIGTTTPTNKLEVSSGNICVSGAGVFKKNGALGVGGTFTTVDTKTVTVSGGIIISIV